jgi:hypothetical protein
MKLGTDCADGIMAMRKSDGSDNSTPYDYGDQPGDYVATPPAFDDAWGPNWHLVTPWCMLTGDQFRPVGPPGYAEGDMTALLTSAEYTANYNDVKELGALDSKTRTEYETETARFWANDRDGTFKPPGHLLYITDVVAENEGHTLEEKARLFALVALGMADAGVAAWDSKFATPIDLWRPVTGIVQGDTDGNDDTEADPAWVPLSHDPDINGFTPPFPAYISGHATFGAVHAAVLSGFYGTDDKTFTIGSDDTPGVFRTYNSFSEAALENGRSRIFLGVHWQFDADGGYEVGTALGQWVLANYLRRFGDVNADGVVSVSDLAQVITEWGGCPEEPSLCPGDMNHDGNVDVQDLVLVIVNWG